MKVLYLWLIRFVSNLSRFKRKKLMIFFVSFDNNLDLIKAMAKKMPNKKHLIVFYEPSIEAAATDLAARGIRTIQFRNNLSFVFKYIPLVMQARVLFCDNYYAFLGGLAHPNSMKIVQLWHANGAIKRFGWEDKATDKRSNADKRRFQAVYDHFDDFVVASEAMGQVFQNSYHIADNHIKLLGYPRSDRFLHETWIKRARNRVQRVAPELLGRRVIFYAPTYREGIKFELPDGIMDAFNADPEAIVVIKLHPVLKQQEAQLRHYSNSRIKFYDQLSTADILTVTDTLITDYSSVAFDFALLKNAKSIIFFMFDLPAYEQNPGIQTDLLAGLPTEPVQTVTGLTAAIKANSTTDFTRFNETWNTYNDGLATGRVVDHYQKLLKKK
ncbi:CDP-glycerol-poly(glycerophosphate) glycerophosphotransferase [Secundilactobacillus oryzae JCM 18671]|uniref:CDP-glycerol-poly(Glycerophosphate) glycerophosphotransferase n=1 Tax=Secundilactobacillus oryzae JCM 18671 TaxID=1291743 RepID=A0A081BHD1_9LACO|nr:CDP-glycerol glycerophosphotransferase family protein [Secundilactobacillus oryzae]GAK47449.1 CDP-glycerol-poly(glycerophosphate) glycerophosphotransferase [Secundilactobacillus oryzae JCM 18671]